MSMSRINISDGSIEIVITGESSQFFNDDLHTQATVTLIECADTHGWEKHQLEHFGESTANEDFYAAVLGAIARHAFVDLIGFKLLPPDPTIDDVLTMLLNNLREQGRLSQIVRFEDDDSE